MHELDVALLAKDIDAERERFKVRGTAVVVVQDGEVVLSTGFGERDAAKGLPVTDTTLFAIGSSTKAFTCTVLATLVDEGLLSWDRPVRHYLPKFDLVDPVATANLTLRDMLSHRSGLPRHDLVWYGDTALARKDVVERLAVLKPNKGLRELWQYNNLMYITAGYLTELTLGCTWEEAVRQRILDPLGMTNTNFSVVDSQRSADHSLPYIERPTGEVALMPFRGLDLAGPAGSINSCVADMSRWLLLNCGGGEVDGQRLVSAAALREIHSVSMAMPDAGRLFDEVSPVGYGMGWMVDNYRGQRVLHHGGNIDGFSALVSFAPKANTGVVILTNMNATPMREVVAYRVWDEVFGLESLPWGERLRGVVESMMTGATQAKEHRAGQAKPLPPSHPLEEYAGLYVHPGYGTFAVTVVDDKLVPDFHGLDASLAHRHLDVWDLRVELQDQELPIAFQTNFDAEVDGLIAVLEPTVDPIRFERQADPALSDPAVLARFVGSYVMGPLAVKVTLNDSGVLIGESQPGGTFELEPWRGTTFGVKGAPMGKIEFVVDGDKVVRLVAGAGIFERVVEG